MSRGEWVVGWIVLAVQLGAVAVAGNGLRRRLAPQTTGTPVAPVATAVCAVSVAVVSSQVLGSLGLLRAWAVPVVTVALAIVLDPGRRPWRVAPVEVGAALGAAVEPHGREGRATRWVAAVGVVLIVAAWADRVVAVYRRGTTDGDSMMYHLPFAARFVQSGWTTGTAPVGSDAWVAFYPANVEVLQAWTMLPFGTDVAIPLLNFAWLALALGAAYAVGAACGRASVGVAAVGVLLCLPVLVATQAGTARVDIATIALVLSAVAVLGACPRSVGSVAVAGLAVGLAVGAKVALLPLAGAMLVAVGAVLWRRHSWRYAAALGGAAVLTSAYWYVRNWLVTGNPVPAIDLRLGPIGFAPLPEDRMAYFENSSLIDRMDAPGFWGNIGRGLADQFTGSPFVSIGIGIVVVGVIVLIVRQRPLGVRHAVLAAGVVGAVVYPFAPYSAPIEGHPTSEFLAVLIVVLNVRYLLPSLAVLLCLVPVALRRLPTRAGDVLAVVAVGATGLLWRRCLWFDAEWPTTTGDGQLAAAATVVAAAAVAGVWALARRRPDPGRWATAGLLAVALVAALALSAPGTGEDAPPHTYDAVPYDLAQLFQATDEVAVDRVALVGGWAGYPHMGLELGTEVDYVGVPRGRGLTDPPTDCAELEASLADGDYDAVVAQQHTYGDDGTVVRLIDCLRAREGATVVADTGAGAVFLL